ncbi:MAG: hypothetical protein J6T99_11030 [Oscillospiraceae bacterium]|nr:hypothetical protein [Oscillospiraceae bacterium]
MKKFFMFLFLILLLLPVMAFAEGELPTEPFTWAYLVTIGGATVAVLLFVQVIKLPLDKIWKIPTKIVVYFVSLIVLLLATHFTTGLTVSDGFLAAFNALIVTAAAWGLYEVTFRKSDEKKLE